jgi:predicted nuclease of predicted toxin-antitoxin system
VKILIDMNLPPAWCEILRQDGWEAVHWSEVGSPTATDREVLSYAERNRYVVFTHDLDFSAMLALARATGPSVIQVRAQDTLSEQFRAVFVDVLRRFSPELDAGAVVVVEQSRARVRILPLESKPESRT